MAAEKHVIKKYANRKLYDTETSRYITLDGISELVRDGHDIKVVDRESGRDLTPLILSQIVMGDEKRSGNGHDASDRIQERGQALLGYVRRTLSVPAALVTGEVGRRASDLEELVDLAVEQAFTRFSIPTRRDIDALSARVDELARRIERVKGSGSTSRRETARTATRTRRAAARR